MMAMSDEDRADLAAGRLRFMPIRRPGIDAMPEDRRLECLRLACAGVGFRADEAVDGQAVVRLAALYYAFVAGGEAVAAPAATPSV